MSPIKNKGMHAHPFSLNVCVAMAFAALSLGAVAQPGDGWTLKRDRGGVKVYTREVPGTNLKELWFTSTLDASLSSIAALLTDVEGFDSWVYAAEHSEVIRKVSDQEFYYYTIIDFPWPFQNRDLVLYSRFWQDPHTLAFHSQTTSAHWLKPEQKGLVRITEADLRWTFTPLGNGKVRVDYYLKSDPAGNIPAWMVNLAADQGPLQTLASMRRELKKGQYQHRQLAFIRER